MNPYIGHETQISGVEEHRLVGGKGDGMRLYEATNGKGLELTLSPDRNGDITRLRYKGINMSYFMIKQVQTGCSHLQQVF